MKMQRIKLAEWQYTTDESANYLDIDWPKVQRQVGSEELTWLLKQDNDHCQLVLDKTGCSVKLMAEFYDEKCLALYHLMWAK